MKPLLQITTTPARYEYEITRARLEISQQQPTVDRTTKRATINMRTQAGKLEMNTVRRRSDMGLKGVVDRANYDADLGKNAAVEATRNYVAFGEQVKNFHKGANIPDAMWNKWMQQNKQGDLVLIPLSPVDIHYIPSSLEMDYQPAQMNTNWNVGRARLDFVPGSFSLNFTQYASISIEYLGGPMYVPPSADPDFEAMA